jgi:multiple sugar transport system ATP-binding protein
VVLGARPEHITIGSERSVSAKLGLVEPTGSETHLTATLDAQEIVCVSRERVRVRPGEDIRLGFDGGPMHYFDPTTGLAIGHA